MRQAQLLRGYLGERCKAQVPVVAAMRYGKPSIAAGLAELQAKRRATAILVLPMYPQYAGSTTGSVEDAVKRGAAASGARARGARGAAISTTIRAYVKAIAKNVNDYWMKHGRPDQLVMSFHGIPKAVVDRGDPYQAQCLESARLIATELGWNDARTMVTFQSRFGKAEWLAALHRRHARASWAREDAGRVDVICPGFAADCLETLEEIAHRRRGTRSWTAGGKEFHYIPTTNDTPAWMTALTAIALESRTWQDRSSMLTSPAGSSTPPPCCWWPTCTPACRSTSFFAALIAALVLGLVNAVDPARSW